MIVEGLFIVFEFRIRSLELFDFLNDGLIVILKFFLCFLELSIFLLFFSFFLILAYLVSLHALFLLHFEPASIYSLIFLLRENILENKLANLVDFFLNKYLASFKS